MPTNKSYDLPIVRKNTANQLTAQDHHHNTLTPSTQSTQSTDPSAGKKLSIEPTASTTPAQVRVVPVSDAPILGSAAPVAVADSAAPAQDSAAPVSIAPTWQNPPISPDPTSNQTSSSARKKLTKKDKQMDTAPHFIAPVEVSKIKNP